MANIKVSELNEAISFEEDDYTMIVQNNQSKKISKENMLYEKYSTTEKQTNNVWIDNKPIYRKVFTGTNVRGNTLQIPDLDKIIHLYGFAKDTSNYWIPITSSGDYANGDWFFANYRNDSIYKGVFIQAGNNFDANSEYYIIVEYTKTTN